MEYTEKVKRIQDAYKKWLKFKQGGAKKAISFIFTTIGLLFIIALITMIFWWIAEELFSGAGTINPKENLIESSNYIFSSDTFFLQRLTASANLPSIFGEASWYDYDCLYGECKSEYCSLDRKIEGKCYSQQNLTCASRDYPRGTNLMVTNIANGKQVPCRVNDWVENPDVILDLSSVAFSGLAPLSQGIIQEIKIRVIN